ncbi:MAG: hypothetical protein K2O04_01995 [Clostridiales bacterium]|nr:hypothetical protein [Clostridiales bacterium]
MTKPMTKQDILRLSSDNGLSLSAEECERTEAHIQKQLYSFAALESINTDNVEPTFDLQGKGRFTVSRCGE